MWVDERGALLVDLHSGALGVRSKEVKPVEPSRLDIVSLRRGLVALLAEPRRGVLWLGREGLFPGPIENGDVDRLVTRIEGASLDGRVAVVAVVDPAVRHVLVNLDDLKGFSHEAWTVPLGEEPPAIAVSPQGGAIARWTNDGPAEIWVGPPLARKGRISRGWTPIGWVDDLVLNVQGRGKIGAWDAGRNALRWSAAAAGRGRVGPQGYVLFKEPTGGWSIRNSRTGALAVRFPSRGGEAPVSDWREGPEAGLVLVDAHSILAWTPNFGAPAVIDNPKGESADVACAGNAKGEFFFAGDALASWSKPDHVIARADHGPASCQWSASGNFVVLDHGAGFQVLDGTGAIVVERNFTGNHGRCAWLVSGTDSVLWWDQEWLCLDRLSKHDSLCVRVGEDEAKRPCLFAVQSNGSQNLGRDEAVVEEAIKRVGTPTLWNNVKVHPYSGSLLDAGLAL